jgi:tape measure domain-containing protein
MKINYWKAEAKKVINKEIEAMMRDGFVGKEKLSPEKKEVFKKRIDKAYPFGERRGLPYKQWLEARKEVFYLYGCISPLKTGEQPFGDRRLTENFLAKSLNQSTEKVRPLKMEDLRQLSEVMPNAMQVAAEHFGMSPEELKKAIADGSLG